MITYNNDVIYVRKIRSASRCGRAIRPNPRPQCPQCLSLEESKVTKLNACVPVGCLELLINEIHAFNGFLCEFELRGKRNFGFPFYADHKLSQSFTIKQQR